MLQSYQRNTGQFFFVNYSSQYTVELLFFQE